MDLDINIICQAFKKNIKEELNATSILRKLSNIEYTPSSQGCTKIALDQKIDKINILKAKNQNAYATQVLNNMYKKIHIAENKIILNFIKNKTIKKETLLNLKEILEGMKIEVKDIYIICHNKTTYNYFKCNNNVFLIDSVYIDQKYNNIDLTIFANTEEENEDKPFIFEEHSFNLYHQDDIKSPVHYLCFESVINIKNLYKITNYKITDFIKDELETKTEENTHDYSNEFNFLDI